MKVFCRASFNYAAKTRGEGIGREPVEMDVFDGRTAGLPGWQECGFELVSHNSMIEDWTDDAAIAAVHYPEMEDLARTLTGCDYALLSDHVKRTPEQSKRPREQSPVTLVHSDCADAHADFIRRSYREVKGRGAATLERSGATADDVEQASRIVVLQFWRNVGPPRMDYPLAFCDARTVRRDQARPFPYTGYVAGGQKFDALAVAAPDAPADHHWFCFPEMTRDEVVAFRTYDTEMVPTDRTYFTPHSAFRDPDVEVANPARFSIELRVACLYR